MSASLLKKFRKKKDSSSTFTSYDEVSPSPPPPPADDLRASQNSAYPSFDEGIEVDPNAGATRYPRRGQTVKVEPDTKSGATTIHFNVNVNSSPPPPPQTPSSRYVSSSPSPSSTPSVPRCRTCSKPGTRKVTRSSNRNGNAGRWYWRCDHCNNFMMWAPDCPVAGSVGMQKDNPLCDCGRPSRRDISGRDKGRKIFLSCAAGQCHFFEFLKNDDGSDHPGFAQGDVAEALRLMKIA